MTHRATLPAARVNAGYDRDKYFFDYGGTVASEEGLIRGSTFTRRDAASGGAADIMKIEKVPESGKLSPARSIRNALQLSREGRPGGGWIPRTSKLVVVADGGG